jgi:hypothetical protein
MMSGPFTLKYLHLFLRDRSAGAFILSRNGRSADYVGSSADDLADAVRRAARKGEYKYFWFSYAPSADQAVDLEYTWYHRYRPTDNASVPKETAVIDWRCTIEGCAACALAAAH